MLVWISVGNLVSVVVMSWVNVVQDVLGSRRISARPNGLFVVKRWSEKGEKIIYLSIATASRARLEKWTILTMMFANGKVNWLWGRSRRELRMLEELIDDSLTDLHPIFWYLYSSIYPSSSDSRPSQLPQHLGGPKWGGESIFHPRTKQRPTAGD